MPKKSESPRLTISPSSEIIEFLERLAEIGIHGKTKSEVAKNLISYEIERLIREGILELRK